MKKPQTSPWEVDLDHFDLDRGIAGALGIPPVFDPVTYQEDLERFFEPFLEEARVPDRPELFGGLPNPTLFGESLAFDAWAPSYMRRFPTIYKGISLAEATVTYEYFLEISSDMRAQGMMFFPGRDYDPDLSEKANLDRWGYTL